MEVLTSELLDRVEGVRHAFTTRNGGVSTGAYEGLNLDPFGPDEPAHVSENLSRLSRALGTGEVSFARQVHGTDVVEARAAGAGVQADGVFSSENGRFMMVRVADCAPVLIARRDGTAVAAVHAGWRGAVARIASRALKSLGTSDVVAAIGPCIGPCCFEVGAEVVTAAKSVAGEAVVSTSSSGTPHVDLAAVVAADLMNAGVACGHIDILRACTVCQRFLYSHRRDKGVTGRQVGVIGIR